MHTIARATHAQPDHDEQLQELVEELRYILDHGGERYVQELHKRVCADAERVREMVRDPQAEGPLPFGVR